MMTTYEEELARNGWTKATFKQRTEWLKNGCIVSYDVRLGTGGIIWIRRHDYVL